MRRRAHRFLVLAVPAAVCGALTVSGSAAFASCAEDSGPDGSHVVFVGTLEEERRGYSRLAVQEVWVGPDLAPEVWVLTGQEQPPFPFTLFSGVSSSVDADLRRGERYVVGASEAFSTNACSIADVSDESTLDEQRPPVTREPSEAGSEGADPPAGPVEIALWGAGVVSAVGILVWALCRRRGRQSG